MRQTDALIEAFGVERDRDNRGKRQPRDCLAVRANGVEAPAIAADKRAPCLQITNANEVLSYP